MRNFQEILKYAEQKGVMLSKDLIKEIANNHDGDEQDDNYEIYEDLIEMILNIPYDKSLMTYHILKAILEADE